MTNSEINSVVMIAVAFLVGGVLMTFVATGVAEADKKASNKVQLHNQDQLNQLIMYNTLIAHVCDDSVAAGALDNSGSRMYDSWKSYKKLWVNSNGNSGPIPPLFNDLNKTFPRQELNCIGTGTTFGATSPGSFIDPTSKEWRNDMEGKHSRVRFVVNGTDNWYDGDHNPYNPSGLSSHRLGNVGPAISSEYGRYDARPSPSSNTDGDNVVWTPPCFWFDQPSDSQAGGVSSVGTGSPRDSAGNGFEGITDASYYFAKPDHMNFYFRFWGGMHNGGSPNVGGGNEADHPNGCPVPWRKKAGSGPGDSNLQGGPGIMVTIVLPGSANHNNFFRNQVTMKGIPCAYEPDEGGEGRCIGGKLGKYDDSSSYITSGFFPDQNSEDIYEIEYNEVKFCEGMRGYIQTNTGYTIDEGAAFPNERSPSYRFGNLPGFADRERWNPENAPKDNSLHPVIVINDLGKCA